MSEQRGAGAMLFLHASFIAGGEQYLSVNLTKSAAGILHSHLVAPTTLVSAMLVQQGSAELASCSDPCICASDGEQRIKASKTGSLSTVQGCKAMSLFHN